MMSGIWWERVDLMPPGQGFRLGGDPNAWSRRLWVVWRYQWRWRLLKAPDIVPPEGYGIFSDSAVRLYFESEGVRMRFRRPIHKRYIAVRVGPTTARFLATRADTDEEVELRACPVFGRKNSDEWWFSLRDFRAAEEIAGDLYGSVDLRAFMHYDIEWV